MPMPLNQLLPEAGSSVLIRELTLDSRKVRPGDLFLAVPGIDQDGRENMADAIARARDRWPGLRTMAFGDLFLEDIRAWRVANLARVGWDVVTPLFGRDTASLAHEMIDGGLRAQLCCVDTQQLDAGFAGRDFDRALLGELPAHVDARGENGEVNTCV